MRITEKRQVTRTEEVTIDCRCDLCGNKAWPTQGRVEIEVKRNYRDYDGGGAVEEFDICKDCWPKIKAFIGKEPHKFDY